MQKQFPLSGTTVLQKGIAQVALGQVRVCVTVEPQALLSMATCICMDGVHGRGVANRSTCSVADLHHRCAVAAFGGNTDSMLFAHQGKCHTPGRMRDTLRLQAQCNARQRCSTTQPLDLLRFRTIGCLSVGPCNSMVADVCLLSTSTMAARKRRHSLLPLLRQCSCSCLFAEEQLTLHKCRCPCGTGSQKRSYRQCWTFRGRTQPRP